ncbi:helix-turn-helix domain-containing protein [Glycomyces tenuis]|uniref:helix-turn-helix domain-containing protein n=1 Tax=Glycomyces tenuis TaxID=58116 RepID=UPI0012DDA5EC|nr:helix-turn-helix transcriptional regulator [Glycomyces tenuis]
MKTDLGLMLAGLREAKGWTQQQLITEGQVRTSRSSVANTETGRQFPDERFWTECDRALDAEETLLVAYRQVFDALQEQKRAEAVAARQRLEDQRKLWSGSTQPAAEPDWDRSLFATTTSTAASPIGMRVAQGSQLDAAIEHLKETWHTLVRTDNLFGPRHALASVQQQLAILESLLGYVRGEQRYEALTLASKYAESAAWLYEDTADMGSAENWTRQALEWATEAGDQTMVSWTMFRRSQQATTRQNAVQTISLAQAAQRNESLLMGPARAAARQQEAHGFALEGDERECQKRLDEAHEFAASPDTSRDGRTGHGDFCTLSYIEVQRANCWLTLGRPDLAVPVLERAMTQIPKVYHRDRGQAQVRLSKAYAEVGHYDAAAAQVASVFHIARDSGSTRMLVEAVSVARVIAAECDSPVVSDLLAAVRGAKEA